MFKWASRPAPRPPPPYNPVVESWLDGLPEGSKPSRQELRQWDLKNEFARKRSSFLASIILRSFSLACALITIIVTLIALRYRWWDQRTMIAILPPCFAIIIWDLVEFVVMGVYRDRGLPANVHIWVDAVLFISVTVSVIFIFIDLINTLVDYRTTTPLVEAVIAQAAFLIALMIIHAVLYFFYACNCLDIKGRKRLKPRVMYLATGQPVFVTESPYPQDAWDSHSAVELGDVPRPVPGIPAQQADDVELPLPAAPEASVLRDTQGLITSSVRSRTIEEPMQAMSSHGHTRILSNNRPDDEDVRREASNSSQPPQGVRQQDMGIGIAS